MDKPRPNFHFGLMSLIFKLRDLFRSPMKVLREVGIRPGYHVVDYGCGPGSYVYGAAELVGRSGKIYAVDIHPLAIRAVKRLAARKNVANVQTILSDRDTGLPDNSVDVVLLYDTFHELSDPDQVLHELHRVLKPKGVLSLSDHHMKGSEIVRRVTERGLFSLWTKGKRTYTFLKEVGYSGDWSVAPASPRTNCTPV